MDKTNKLLILWSIHIGSMHEIAKSLKFSTLMGHYIEPKLSFLSSQRNTIRWVQRDITSCVIRGTSIHKNRLYQNSHQ